MEHLFDVAEAKAYGVYEAIVIRHFRFWILHNRSNGSFFYEGRTWTYGSYEALAEVFPYFTYEQIRRIVRSLKEKDVILTTQDIGKVWDRTTYYAFTDEEKFLDGKDNAPESANTADSPIWENPQMQVGKPTDDKCANPQMSSVKTHRSYIDVFKDGEKDITTRSTSYSGAPPSGDGVAVEEVEVVPGSSPSSPTPSFPSTLAASLNQKPKKGTTAAAPKKKPPALGARSCTLTNHTKLDEESKPFKYAVRWMEARAERGLQEMPTGKKLDRYSHYYGNAFYRLFDEYGEEKVGAVMTYLFHVNPTQEKFIWIDVKIHSPWKFFEKSNDPLANWFEYFYGRIKGRLSQVDLTNDRMTMAEVENAMTWRLALNRDTGRYADRNSHRSGRARRTPQLDVRRWRIGAVRAHEEGHVSPR